MKKNEMTTSGMIMSDAMKRAGEIERLHTLKVLESVLEIMGDKVVTSKRGEDLNHKIYIGGNYFNSIKIPIPGTLSLKNVTKLLSLSLDITSKSYQQGVIDTIILIHKMLKETD